jgi:hypothetical protein
MFVVIILMANFLLPGPKRSLAHPGTSGDVPHRHFDGTRRADRESTAVPLFSVLYLLAA